MGLRRWMKRLERNASEDFESFELLDGSTYYYDRLETYKELFLHAYDVQLGAADKWPEAPEVYSKICEARDVAAVLERFKPEDPQRAFVNLDELYDTDVLVRERRLGRYPIRRQRISPSSRFNALDDFRTSRLSSVAGRRVTYDELTDKQVFDWTR